MSTTAEDNKQQQQQQQPPLGGKPRGWIGFGRNYFHALTSNDDPPAEWKDVPQESSDVIGEGGPYYSWGVDDENDTTTTTTTTTTASSSTPSTYDRPLVAYQFTGEIPNKPKRKKTTSNNNSNTNNKTQQPELNQKQIAPAACSSAASFFLSGARHNRIITFGTIHGRVMNPVLEAAQQQQQQQQQQQKQQKPNWNPSMPSPTTSTIALPLPVVELAAGRHFCLARLEGGLAVLSWGAGHFGQLGHGASSSSSSNSSGATSTTSTSTYQATPKVMDRLLPRMVGSPIAQIAAGDWHGMALTEGDGTVLAWGCNRNLQCGRKTPRAGVSGGTTQTSPSAAAAAAAAPLQMTPQPVVILDADPEKANDPPIAIAKITCGKAHSVAISKTNQVYCWGASHYGQCASNSGSSSVRSSKYTRNTTTLPRLVHSLQDVTVVDVAAGDRHTLALTQGGRVFSWGAGAEGQLGIFPPIVATPRPRLIHDLDFVAIAAGEIMQPQPSGGADGSGGGGGATKEQQQAAAQTLSSVPTITSLHVAGCSSAALSSSGHVYVWGSNDAGSLGLQVPHASRLPYWEVGSTPLPPNDERLLQVKTFDSDHNVLLPRRVDALAQIHVEQIMMGPSHTWHLGEVRSTKNTKNDNGTSVPIGRTLYEVQQLRKANAAAAGATATVSGAAAAAAPAGLSQNNSSLTTAGSSGASASFENSTVQTSFSRRLLSPSSTMPTDDEDEVTACTDTNNSMSASMPALTAGGVGTRRGAVDSPTVNAPATNTSRMQRGNSTGSTSSSSSKRQGRRHSESMLSNAKNRPFSLPNLLRRLGGSSRKNKERDRINGSSERSGGGDASEHSANGGIAAAASSSAGGSESAGNGDRSESSSGKGRFRLR